MNWGCEAFWAGKEILISGGTGSLGKALLKLFIDEKFPLKGLRILSRDELKQWQIRRTLPNNLPFPISFLIGDIKSPKRVKRSMKGVDICIHTAALKQVDTAEDNPFEYIETNIIGTQNIMEACLDCGVDKAMLISTDKAVYPVNLYGMSKGCAERIFIHGNIYSGGRKPIFGCCRYGNVLASRGSVVQVFRDQAEAGGPLTVTDGRMTRFWITLDRVARFIVRSISVMKAGQTFVPKMPSMKVAELAKTIAFDEGLKEIEFKEIGIRPGEKLHECLVTEEESHKCAIKDDHYLIHPVEVWPPEAPRFSYTSANNNWWLTEDELREMINGIS